MLYFAYGSNLNLDQMSRRCPAATPVGAAQLPNARLVFRGVCDVVFIDGETCPGGIWKITRDCERRLDTYEGFNPDYPDSGMYSKEYVAMDGLPDGETHVMVYVMNSTGIYPPSRSYYDGVRQGYRDFGLDVEPLKAALERSYDDKHPSHIERQRARRNGRPALKPRPAAEPVPQAAPLSRKAKRKAKRQAAKHDRQGPKPGRQSRRYENHDPWADTSWANKPKRKNLSDWLDERRDRGLGF